MADSPIAIIFAAIVVSSGAHIFTKSNEKTEGCGSISSIIFLTAVFAWVTAKNINIFRCRLPESGNFIYEFFMSLFIFEMAIHLFWEPLEYFINNSLPSLIEGWLMDGDCCFYGFYCPGDTMFYTVLVYVTALWFVWLVLYGYGVINEKL